ncbi:AbiJ-NTD4 domain-containing protein [Labrys portucalensis]|uniref:AbiJ-NTD4 domain-containing protein n=1 Tax=Labrys neptuniae TaxID=376174 RepID=A0ABV6ZRH1_9HYPH
MSRFFSERYSYMGPEPPITVREDAPRDLRYAVVLIAEYAGLSASDIRRVVCQVLIVPPDTNNWSPQNVKDEAANLLLKCPWFKVYDIAEALWRSMEYNEDAQLLFQNELNRCFREKGIGWELKDANGIMFRGEQGFSQSTRDAVQALKTSGRPTAAGEIEEALAAISRRPEPNRTGAVRHAIAALECVARDLTNKPNATLGSIIVELDLPKPLDEAVKKLWGYASDRARHLREGQTIETREAELVVSVACALCSYLVQKEPGSS